MIRSAQIWHSCCLNRCFHLDYCFDVYDDWCSSNKDFRGDVRRRVAYRCDDVNPLSVGTPVSTCGIEMVWNPCVFDCEWSSSMIERKPCRTQYIYEVFLLKSKDVQRGISPVSSNCSRMTTARQCIDKSYLRMRAWSSLRRLELEWIESIRKKRSNLSERRDTDEDGCENNAWEMRRLDLPRMHI